ADHLLAAILLGPQFQLGRASGLGGGARRSRLAAFAALSRRHRLDPRLRHDLRPSGQGGRRADRRQILGAGARQAHAPFPLHLLRGGMSALGAGGASGGARPRLPRRSRARLLSAVLAGGADRYREFGRLPREVQIEPLDGLDSAPRHHRRACRLIRPLSFARRRRSRRRRSRPRSGCISPAKSRRSGTQPRRASQSSSYRRPIGPLPGQAAKRSPAISSTIATSPPAKRRSISAPARASSPSPPEWPGHAASPPPRSILSQPPPSR